jgi:two-component system, NtrC family, sensor kinase
VSGSASGRSAIALPWLCPTAESLLALTEPTPKVSLLQSDLGFLAHVARYLHPSLTPTCQPWHKSVLLQPSLAASAATLLETAHSKKMVIHAILPETLRASVEQAGHLAELLAEERSYPSPAMAGFVTRLAYLGWSVIGPARAEKCLAYPEHRLDSLEVQRRCFGLDIPTVTRRLMARWRFPNWLTATLSSLNLPSTDAVQLGAPQELFVIVRASLAVVEQMTTPVGFTSTHLTDDRPSEEAFLHAAKLFAQVPTALAHTPAHSPKPVGLYVRLLSNTAHSRKAEAASIIAAAEERIDKLTELLTDLRREFDHELRDAKLGGLAEFAAGAGHEINNPLAVISGNAQLILGKETDPGKQKALLTIIRQTKRIHDILQGTRHFARPPQPNVETVELARWLPGVVNSLSGEAEAKSISLTTDLHAVHRSLCVKADNAHLRQALGHLIQNAIEAAPKGGWVRVGVDPLPRFVRITVDDSGPGPEHEQLEHLFDPFFSGRSAGRGRGIGLSIAWRLAQLNGGDVRFTPKPDGTTRFTLTLPRELAQTAPVPQRKSA